MTDPVTGPHGRAPDLDRDMGTYCIFCKGRSFRRSRLKPSDLLALLVLRYPVRCLSCSKRQTVGLPVATRAVPSSVMQVRASTEETSKSDPALPGVRIKPAPAAAGEGTQPPSLILKAAMPNLHGVKLAHTAYVPPGDGENLAP